MWSWQDILRSTDSNSQSRGRSQPPRQPPRLHEIRVSGGVSPGTSVIQGNVRGLRALLRNETAQYRSARQQVQNYAYIYDFQQKQLRDRWIDQQKQLRDRLDAQRAEFTAAHYDHENDTRVLELLESNQHLEARCEIYDKATALAQSRAHDIRSLDTTGESQFFVPRSQFQKLQLKCDQAAILIKSLEQEHEFDTDYVQWTERYYENVVSQQSRQIGTLTNQLNMAHGQLADLSKNVTFRDQRISSLDHQLMTQSEQFHQLQIELCQQLSLSSQYQQPSK